ncbi:hypothetical protein [Clostridium algidicarnis]|uniref:hypothetical protein n=1 Tax=Clostridium algidicarnis TaxID=37659 RepID=UPI000AD7F230|nr:hypothetical protein [Clostridium algidicarnis]
MPHIKAKIRQILKCPSCKKTFCLRKDGTEVMNREQDSVAVEAKQRIIMAI